MSEPSDFVTDLTELLNRYSAESVSGTPDFILAGFLQDSIKAFNAAVVLRADWRSEPIDILGKDVPLEPEQIVVEATLPVIKGVADAHPFHHNL